MELGCQNHRLKLYKVNEEWQRYYSSVIRDFAELKNFYPFSWLLIPPTIQPKLASIKVIAANADLIKKVCGQVSDFIGEYTKELYIEVPIYYNSLVYSPIKSET